MGSGNGIPKPLLYSANMVYFVILFPDTDALLKKRLERDDIDREALYPSRPKKTQTIAYNAQKTTAPYFLYA